MILKGRGVFKEGGERWRRRATEPSRGTGEMTGFNREKRDKVFFGASIMMMTTTMATTAFIGKICSLCSALLSPGQDAALSLM